MNKISASIVAGFLGAGKTTLLNHVLKGTHGRRVAVLVNDFGEINIDSQLISRVEGEIISLANGCVCCTIRSDLANAVLNVIAAEPRPEYIVIETSGVSEPAGAAMGLVMSTEVARSVQLDAIVTVVDSGEVLELQDDQAALAADQVAAADIVIANKSDLADEAMRRRVSAWIRDVAPQARIVEASHCRVPLELVFGLGESAATSGHTPHRHSHHEHESDDSHTAAFSTWSWQHTEPLSFEAIYGLFKSLPLSIFRAKGIINLQAVPERRVILQMVGKRVLLSKGEPWQGKPRSTQIAVIGSAGAVDGQALQKRLEACLARNAPSGQNRMAEAVVEILRRA